MLILEASFYTEVISSIPTVGFPVACCVLMGFYIREKSKRDEKTYAQYNKRYEALTNRVLDSQERNVEVLTELTTLIKTYIGREVDEDGDKEINHGDREGSH